MHVPKHHRERRVTGELLDRFWRRTNASARCEQKLCRRACEPTCRSPARLHPYQSADSTADESPARRRGDTTSLALQMPVGSKRRGQSLRERDFPVAPTLRANR